MPAGATPGAPACAETVTPSSWCGAACLQRPVPLLLNQPVPTSLTLLNFNLSSKLLGAMPWPLHYFATPLRQQPACTGLLALHMRLCMLTWCMLTCVQRLPWLPHAGPTSGSAHAQNLGLLMWEAHPVAAPPGPSPAAAAAAGAAPSPLPPKVAVRIGQGAKGLSVLLALLLERRAAAAGCRAEDNSMPECAGALPVECSAS